MVVAAISRTAQSEREGGSNRRSGEERYVAALQAGEVALGPKGDRLPDNVATLSEQKGRGALYEKTRRADGTRIEMTEEEMMRLAMEDAPPSPDQ